MPDKAIQTMIINVFGGPGAGKTGSAWEIASELKKRNLHCEYVPEYAKECVYDGTISTVTQTEIYAEQKRRIDVLVGKVPFVVTDSPIILSGIVYAENEPAEFRQQALADFNSYENFNFIIRRGDHFEKVGRIHNEQQSKQLDADIKQILDENHINYGTYYHKTLDVVVRNVINHYEYLQKTRPEATQLETPAPVTEKQRLFVDMDGTTAVFTPVDEVETLYEPGFFENAAQMENVVDAVKIIIAENPDKEVKILSSYLTDSEYALDEKNRWLDKYLPEISAEDRIFVPCGEDKKSYIPGGVRESDYLLDDYTINLNNFEPPAKGIKLLNGINHTKGTWQSDRLRFDKTPDELAADIVAIMNGEAKVLDEIPRIAVQLPSLAFEEYVNPLHIQNNLDIQSSPIPLTGRAKAQQDLLVEILEKEVKEGASSLTTDEKNIKDILVGEKRGYVEVRPKESKPFYDYEALREIPIEEVCETFGVEVKRANGGMWCKIRDEKTPSVKLYEKTNTFCDFGAGNQGGGTIELVAYINDCDYQTAAASLANAFGIEPMNKYEFDIKPELTDRQYAKIGLYGDRATKNFTFDLEKYSLAQTKRLSDKYAMSMNVLKEKHPGVYESLLRDRAIPYLKEARQDYYSALHGGMRLDKELGITNITAEHFLPEIQQTARELNSVEKVMAQAVKDTKIEFKPVQHDPVKDYKAIASGKIEVQVGTIEYSLLKKQEADTGKKLFYCSVSEVEYAKNQDIAKIEHAAFLKKDVVKISCTQEDARRVQELFPQQQQKTH